MRDAQSCGQRRNIVVTEEIATGQGRWGQGRGMREKDSIQKSKSYRKEKKFVPYAKKHRSMSMHSQKMSLCEEHRAQEYVTNGVFMYCPVIGQDAGQRFWEDLRGYVLETPISWLNNNPSKPITSSSHYSVLLQKQVISVPARVLWGSKKQKDFPCKFLLFPFMYLPSEQKAVSVCFFCFVLLLFSYHVPLA